MKDEDRKKKRFCKEEYNERQNEDNEETKECDCEDCTCDEENNCGCIGKNHCECGCDCEEEGECDCEDCDCEEEHEKCHCHDGHHHNSHTDEHHCNCCGHEEKEEIAGQYLVMAQRLQADFDNYRKRVAEQLDLQKEEGKKSVIEVFLPCLDTFKEAKKSIGDETVLAGINMIEEKILNALKTLKVEKIETIGQKFDHNTMEVIAVMKDETKEMDIVLDEFQAGWTFDGKVIRYAKVIVNKI